MRLRFKRPSKIPPPGSFCEPVRCLVVVLVVFCLACLAAIFMMGLEACRPFRYEVELGNFHRCDAG